MHRSTLSFILLIVAAACSGAGGRPSSSLSWKAVDSSVSPPRSWPGSPLFVQARIGRDIVPEKLPAPPVIVLDSLDGKRRVRLRLRSIDVRDQDHTLIVTLGSIIPATTPTGHYLCRLVARGGTPLSTAGSVRLSPAPDPDDGALCLTLSTHGTLSVENHHYSAVFDRRSGLLRRLSTEPGKAALLSAEQIILNEPAVDASHPLGSEWTVEEQAPFYARIVSRHSLEGGMVLERTLECTDSPHINLTCRLRSEDAVLYPTVTWSMTYPAGSTIETPPAKGHPLLERDRRIFTPEGRELLYGKIVHDLLIREPAAPLGGLDDGLPGLRSVGDLDSANGRLDETVMASGTLWNSDEDGAPRRVGLAPGDALTFGRVITATAEDTDAHDYFHQGSYRLLDRNPFYPGRGRLSAAVTSSRGWTFANWNNFQYAAELAPVHRHPLGARTLFRDRLLSMGAYLVDRLHQDGGWPRWFAWSVYPEGARFTAHARAFPFLVYLWGLLHEQEGRDDPFVDRIFSTLQDTRAYFDPTTASNFADRTGDGVPYIAYSDTYKHADLDDVREVSNTHAHAYRFAHLMAEMSELAGDREALESWTSILDRADRGTQRIFADLYPARDAASGQPIYGLIAYSLHAPGVVKLPYNGISLMGLADSLEHAGRHPLELVEIVERTTTDYRADPSAGPPDPSPEQPFLGRIYRTQPLGLALARDAGQAGPHMAGLIELASLGEVLATDSGSATHDPHLAILIDGGKTVALTDNPFLCEWTAGYFEEMPIDRLDESLRFTVDPASGQALPPGEHWAACRRGKAIEVMASAATVLEVTTSVPPGGSVWLRIDRYGQHAWSRGEPELAGRNPDSLPRIMTFAVPLEHKDHGTLTIEP